jgi:hypothetical protein
MPSYRRIVWIAVGNRCGSNERSGIIWHTPGAGNLLGSQLFPPVD